MKFLFAFLLACTVASAAHAAPPSETSFTELLKLTNTQAKLDAMSQRIDGELLRIFDRVLANQGTFEAAAYTAKFRVNVQANFQKELTLESLAGSYLKDGGGDWTQEEVDALLALAEKPAGRSALAKLGGTNNVIENLTLRRIAQFTKEPAQSLQTAMKELQEINTKALAAQKAQAAAAGGTKIQPDAKPAMPAPATLPVQAEPATGK